MILDNDLGFNLCVVPTVYCMIIILNNKIPRKSEKRCY